MEYPSSPKLKKNEKGKEGRGDERMGEVSAGDSRGKSSPLKGKVAMELVSEPSSNYCFNIVAIHGLETTSSRTWTYNKGGIETNWLRDKDMLPAAVNTARIYTYSWKANYYKNSVENTLSGHADELLFHLKDTLGNWPKPTIFIASCFGGLLLAEAMLRAANPPYEAILWSTVGIVFLGTPFHGTSVVKLIRLQVYVSEALGNNPSRSLAERLNGGDELLRELVGEFTRDMGVGRAEIRMVCFYETEKTELLRKIVPRSVVTNIPPIFGPTRRILVPKKSAVLDGVDSMSLRVSHSNMNKFSGPESSEYVKVRGFIEKYWTESEEVLGRHDLRKVLFRVPVARTENFVGRKDFLEELLKVLLPQKSSETCQLITINGLEGVGKTEVAIEAAYRVKEREDEKCSVFWISAATKEDFESDYRDIGKDLGVDSFSGDIVSLVNKQLNKRPGRWLLIIDDVDDTKNWKLERGSLPTGQNGSILVTTGDRRISARLGGEGKLLEALSNEEAIELLKRPLTDDHIGDDNQAKKLVNFLDRLPLAITLASRYMGLNGISVREYLDLWETRDKKMIQQLCEGSERGGQHGRSSKSSEQAVAETWLISFDRIIKYPKFLGCLRKLAFYGQQKIPRVMLESEGGQDVDDVIRELLAYSFVTKRPNSDLIEVHQLVQLAMRNWLSQRKEFDEGATSAIERLVKSLPFPTPHNRRKWDYMLPHAEEALGFEDDTVYDDAVWRLLYMVGQANFLLNKHERAEAFHRRALKLEELKILRNPSEAPDLRRQGKYEQAEKEYRKAIAEEKENHMDEHPSITTRKKNTACTFFIQGKYEEARVGYQEVLNIEKETLGENHPSTISTMDSLALVLKSLDECGEAENMYKRVLELKEKSPGEHDLSIIASMENLAIMYQHNRKYQKAEGLHERALQLKESVLGEKHPSTLASRDSLALMLERRGEYKEAGSMYRRTLELKRKTWSDSHPSTRRTRVSLALMEEYERESGIKSEGGRTSIHTKG